MTIDFLEIMKGVKLAKGYHETRGAELCAMEMVAFLEGEKRDLTGVVVGSEGTLGAFTRFWLRLLPRPDKVWTFRATYPFALLRLLYRTAITSSNRSMSSKRILILPSS
jgi:hypothetical protein